MKKLDPVAAQSFRRMRLLLNPYNKQCRLPYKNILYQRHRSQMKRKSFQKHKPEQQQQKQVLGNNKIMQILKNQQKMFYKQKVKYNKLYQKNLEKLKNSQYYDMYLKNKKKFQESKTRQRLIQIDARSGRSQFQDFLLKYKFVQNSKWLTKIIQSKFFYYLLIYKVIAWTLKLIFVIYFWDKYFGKEKDKAQKTQNDAEHN